MFDWVLNTPLLQSLNHFIWLLHKFQVEKVSDERLRNYFWLDYFLKVVLKVTLLSICTPFSESVPVLKICTFFRLSNVKT